MTSRSCRDTRLELVDGTAVAEGDEVLGTVIGHTELVVPPGADYPF